MARGETGLSKMKIIDGNVTFEQVDCWWCKGAGIVKIPKQCPNTGLQTYGRKCPYCGGKNKNGHVPLKEVVKLPCWDCKGTGKVMESLFDNFNFSPYLSNIKFIVDRTPKPQTFNEAYLGAGLIFSITDYGEYKKYSTDEELVNYVIDKYFKKETHQGCKLIQNGKLCNTIVIKCNDMGFALKSLWG